MHVENKMINRQSAILSLVFWTTAACRKQIAKGYWTRMKVKIMFLIRVWLNIV